MTKNTPEKKSLVLVDALVKKSYYTGELRAYQNALNEMTFFDHLTGHYTRINNLFKQTLKQIEKVDK